MKNIFSKKKSSGYIAITSVIIISILLITVISALSAANYNSRFNILESEYKVRSLSLAESCVNQALFNLSQGNTAPQNVTVSGLSCSIVSFTPAGANTVVRTQGIFQNSYTNLRVTVKTSDLSFVSWEELPN